MAPRLNIGWHHYGSKSYTIEKHRRSSTLSYHYHTMHEGHYIWWDFVTGQATSTFNFLQPNMAVNHHTGTPANLKHLITLCAKLCTHNHAIQNVFWFINILWYFFKFIFDMHIKKHKIKIKFKQNKNKIKYSWNGGLAAKWQTHPSVPCRLLRDILISKAVTS